MSDHYDGEPVATLDPRDAAKLDPLCRQPERRVRPRRAEDAAFHYAREAFIGAACAVLDADDAPELRTALALLESTGEVYRAAELAVRPG